jgi:hypothetical protein
MAFEFFMLGLDAFWAETLWAQRYDHVLTKKERQPMRAGAVSMAQS